MAGDWIPYCKDLPRKPEVLRLMRITGMSRAEVVFALLEFWSWADDHSTDGVLPGICFNDLSGICPVEFRLDSGSVPDFFQAMRDVGWLQESEEGIQVPRFARWMTNTAKTRALDRRRKGNNQHKLPAIPGKFRSDSGLMPEQNRTTGQDRTGQSKGKNSLTNPSCPEPGKTGSRADTEQAALPIMTFPTAGKEKSWHLTQEQVDGWKQNYPALDILAECRKALAWVEASPERRKTAKGMPRFLVNWFNRAQDRGSRATLAQPVQQTLEERVRAAMEKSSWKGGT